MKYFVKNLERMARELAKEAGINYVEVTKEVEVEFGERCHLCDQKLEDKDEGVVGHSENCPIHLKQD